MSFYISFGLITEPDGHDVPDPGTGVPVEVTEKNLRIGLTTVGHGVG